MSTEGTLLTLSRFLDDVVICGKPDSLEDLIARIDRLTIDDVNASIKKYIAGKWNVSLLLPEKEAAVNIPFRRELRNLSQSACIH